jgi:hypothetical protein
MVQITAQLVFHAINTLNHMKKSFLTISISFLFISCSTNNCIKSYVNNELRMNSISVLIDRKINTSNTLKIYKGVNRNQYSTQAKLFNQQDYEYLIKKYKNDTLIDHWNKYQSSKYLVLQRAKKQGKPYDENEYEKLTKISNDLFEYWSKNQSKSFNFSFLIKASEITKYVDSTNSLKNKDYLYSYSLSNPIFIKSKKIALFSLIKSNESKNVIEDCVIIMIKEKGKWIFAEKVYSSALH